MIHIDFTQMVGDNHLWEIIVGFPIGMLIILMGLFEINRRNEHDKRYKFPTMGQAQAATTEQIIEWGNHLPIPRTQHEINVYGIISERYVNECDFKKLLTAPCIRKTPVVPRNSKIEFVKSVDELLIPEEHGQH